MFATSGRTDEAKKHFMDALEKAPGSARAHLNLGMVFAESGDYRKAAGHYQESIKAGSLTSRDNRAAAHFALGSLLRLSGKSQEAVDHLKKALVFRPGHAKSHVALGLALVAIGDPDAGLLHFQQALQQRYVVPSSLNDMAWSLSTHSTVGARRPAAAIKLAERAVALTNRRDPVFLDTLAVAYAAAGQYKEARRTANEALKQAPPDLAREIRKQLDLFEKGRPL